MLNKTRVYQKADSETGLVLSHWHDENEYWVPSIPLKEINAYVLSSEQLEKAFNDYRDYILQNMTAVPQVSPTAYCFHGSTEEYINSLNID